MYTTAFCHNTIRRSIPQHYTSKYTTKYTTALYDKQHNTIRPRYATTLYDKQHNSMRRPYTTIRITLYDGSNDDAINHNSHDSTRLQTTTTQFIIIINIKSNSKSRHDLRQRI